MMLLKLNSVMEVREAVITAIRNYGNDLNKFKLYESVGQFSFFQLVHSYSHDINLVPR